jgi:Uma2 family endonuclease
MVSLKELPVQLTAEDPEERRMISGVNWQDYEAVLAYLGDSPQYRVTYLDGVLELMSPSRRHERNKTAIGSLLEAYFQETQTPYFLWGSTTLRNEEKRGGTEPDESYCIGTDKDYPDLAIEVVITSGYLNKLEVYQRLGVREVWFFKNNLFEVFCLRDQEYELVENSELLPDLNLSVVAEYAVSTNPLEAALAFREQVRNSQLG